MAYPVMPTMPLSMAAGLKKSPRWNTVRQKGPAGINAAIALMPFCVWDFEFSLDNITGHEHTASSVVAQMLGTFMATAGGAGLFLFADPQDNSVTGAQFGKGDGTSKSFQLSRNIYGYPDIIQNVNGVVTFATAPASGAVLTWTGNFMYACRFAEDTIDATRNFTINNGIDHWMIQGVKFSSEFLPTSTYGIIAAPGGV